MFYDKEIELYKRGVKVPNGKGGYTEGSPIFIKSLMVDVQPYSKELLYEEYGYSIDVSKRIFSDLDNEIKEGILVKYQEKWYEIKKIPWDDEYMDVMIWDTLVI